MALRIMIRWNLSIVFSDCLASNNSLFHPSLFVYAAYCRVQRTACKIPLQSMLFRKRSLSYCTSSSFFLEYTIHNNFVGQKIGTFLTIFPP